MTTTIKSPALRNQVMNDMADSGASREVLHGMRLALTPPALRDLPDHGIRGHKSLGRIQQLTNRGRFKVRTRTAR